MFMAFPFHEESWGLVLDHHIVSFMLYDCMATV